MDTDALRAAMAETSIKSEQVNLDEEAERVTPEEHDVGEQPEDQAIPQGGAQEEPPEEDSETPEQQAERLSKMRIRPRNPEDQQVIDLYRSEGFSGTMADAARVIYAEQFKPQQQQPPEEREARKPADPADTAKQREAEIQSQIAELSEKIKQAADNYDTAEALRLQSEVSDLKLNLYQVRQETALAQKERQRAQADTLRTKALESRDKAIEAYPSLGDRTSVERKQFDAFINQKQQDPDYAAVFNSPRWPEIMAHEFAGVNGLQRQRAQATAQTLNNPRPSSTKPQARVLTSGQTASPQQPATPESLVRNLPNLDSKDLRSLLGSPK